jgi:hypothetical protein
MKQFRNWLENDGMVSEWGDREQQARAAGPETQSAPGHTLTIRLTPAASVPPASDPVPAKPDWRLPRAPVSRRRQAG